MAELVALLFGAVVVFFYSYQRFNRATDETAKQLTGLVSLLSPDRLRSRRVVFRAYVFYAATFLIIYLLLCAYAQLIPAMGGPTIPVGAVKLPDIQVAATPQPTAGFISRAAGDEMTDTVLVQTPSITSEPDQKGVFSIGIDPVTSLAVALMIVGLAPSFPILENFEVWMRGAAHRLAGIPTRVLAIRDDLRTQSLGIVSDPNEIKPKNLLLISPGDWQRMRFYRLALKDNLDSSEALHEDIALIFALSAWVLERRLNLQNPNERERFSEVERELARRREALISSLDERTGYDPDHPRDDTQEVADALVHNIGQGASAKVAQLAKQADELADDMCILLALYAEHEIIVMEAPDKHAEQDVSENQPPVTAKAGGDGDGRGADKKTGMTNSFEQRREAMTLLRNFVDEYAGARAIPSRRPTYAMAVGLWAFFLVLAISAVWSLYIGRWEDVLRTDQDKGTYTRLFSYTLTAFFVYCIPVFTALAIHDASIYLERWKNVRQSAWTERLPQAALIAVVSWAVATILMLSSVFWQGALVAGWRTTASALLASWRFSFEYNGPMTLRGVALALIVIGLLDIMPDRRQVSSLFSFGQGLRGAFIMAIVGACTGWMSTWAGTLQAGAQRQKLDAIDYGLIAYAAIYSAVIGFCVTFAVAEMLLNQRRARGQQSRKREAAR